MESAFRINKTWDSERGEVGEKGRGGGQRKKGEEWGRGRREKRGAEGEGRRGGRGRREKRGAEGEGREGGRGRKEKRG